MQIKLKLIILLIAGTCAHSGMIDAAPGLRCNADSPHDICNDDEECLQSAGTTDHVCVQIEGRQRGGTMNESRKGCNVESGYAICNADEECLEIAGTNYHRCVKIQGRSPSVT